MHALHDVVQAGYVRYIGMSSCHAYQCTCPTPINLIHSFTLFQSTRCKVGYPIQYQLSILMRNVIDYAIQNGLTPFISMQNHYSLLYREEEREMFPTLKVCVSFLQTSESY